MNGDSLTEASSRHSMVCEAKIKIKKTGNQNELCWKKILISYLKCNVVKELEEKKLILGETTHHEDLQPFLQKPMLQLN